MPARSRTYIARARPLELIATRVNEQQMVETLEGTRTAYPGDYILMGTRGERWPVPGIAFDTLYEILGPADDASHLRVRKKTSEVPVFQTYMERNFTTRGEPFHADVGDFILRRAADDIYPSKPDQFFEMYEIVRPANSDEHFTL